MKSDRLQDIVMRVPVCICTLVTHTVNKTGQTTGTTTPMCHDVQMWLLRMLCEPSHPTNQPTKQVTKKLSIIRKLQSQVKVKSF